MSWSNSGIEIHYVAKWENGVLKGSTILNLKIRAMKVICKKVDSQGFDLKEVTTVFSNNFDYSFGGSGLELGKEYTVMGIALYNDSNCLYYLVDASGRPDWFPYLLFETLDNTFPQNWFIKINGKNENSDIYVLWGFDELCNYENYYDQLQQRDEQAMRIYFSRKAELENVQE